MEEKEWTDVKLNVIMLPVAVGTLVFLVVLAICCDRHRKNQIKRMERDARRERIKAAKAKRRNMLMNINMTDVDGDGTAVAAKSPRRQKRKKKKTAIAADDTQGANSSQQLRRGSWQLNKKKSTVEMTIWSDAMATSESGHHANSLSDHNGDISMANASLTEKAVSQFEDQQELNNNGNSKNGLLPPLSQQTGSSAQLQSSLDSVRRDSMA